VRKSGAPRLEQHGLSGLELLAQLAAKAPQRLGHEARLVELRHARVRLGEHLRAAGAPRWARPAPRVAQGAGWACATLTGVCRVARMAPWSPRVLHVACAADVPAAARVGRGTQMSTTRRWEMSTSAPSRSARCATSGRAGMGGPAWAGRRGRAGVLRSGRQAGGARGGVLLG